jgi:hypothetical protein
MSLNTFLNVETGINKGLRIGCVELKTDDLTLEETLNLGGLVFEGNDIPSGGSRVPQEGQTYQYHNRDGTGDPPAVFLAPYGRQFSESFIEVGVVESVEFKASGYNYNALTGGINATKPIPAEGKELDMVLLSQQTNFDFMTIQESKTDGKFIQAESAGLYHYEVNVLVGNVEADDTNKTRLYMTLLKNGQDDNSATDGEKIARQSNIVSDKQGSDTWYNFSGTIDLGEGEYLSLGCCVDPPEDPQFSIERYIIRVWQLSGSYPPENV